MKTAERGMQEIAALQTSLNYVQVGLHLTDVTREKNQMSEEYLSKHPDGVGYSRYMEEGYRNLLQSKIDVSSNREVKNTLQQYMNQSLPHLIDTSAHLELETGRSFCKNTAVQSLDVMTAQLASRPEDEPLIREQYAYTLAGLKGIMREKEHGAFARSAWDSYGKVWGLKLISMNPDRASQFFERGGLNGMVKGTTLMELIHTARVEKDAQQKRHLRELKIKDRESVTSKINVIAGMRADNAFGRAMPTDIAATDLPADVKHKLMNENLAMLDLNYENQKKCSLFRTTQ
jgi:hypothetical protein